MESSEDLNLHSSSNNDNIKTSIDNLENTDEILTAQDETNGAHMETSITHEQIMETNDEQIDLQDNISRKELPKKSTESCQEQVASSKLESGTQKNETVHTDSANSEPSHVDNVNEVPLQSNKNIAALSSKIEVVNDKSLDSVVIESNVLLQPAPDVVISAQIANQTAALSLLAAYGSDDNDSAHEASDNESVVEVPIASTNNYRNKVVELTSDSDEEVISSASSSSDSSDSDDDNSYLKKIRKEIDATIAIMEDDDDMDADEETSNRKNRKQNKTEPLRVKGELMLEDLPPIEDLHISVPAEQCTELGKVQSIVDQLVLVNALPNALLLDLETVLFLEQGQKVLGLVFDVLGQVADPLYCVRFNSHQQIVEKNIQVGDVVYVAPKTEHTQYIILANLMKLKGSDASWDHDVEPPPVYLDYSDDEQERQARALLRNKKRAHNDAAETDEDDNDDAISVCSSVASTVQSFRGGRRGRGAGNNAAQRNQMPHHARPSFHGAYHRPNYDASSWHSNYQHYQPNYRGAGMRPMIHRMPPPMPHHINPQIMPPMQMYAPAAAQNLPLVQAPSAHFSMYATGPGILHPSQMASQAAANSAQYVINPYAVPPPNIATTQQQYQAPPPPPGAQ